MKKTFFEIHFSWISKSSVWNTNFFPGKVYQFFFALDSHYIGDTPYRVCFDLTTLWPGEKDLFLKFLFREIQKVPYENPTFFLGKLNQKYFLLYTVIILLIFKTEFGLNWITPWPDEKKLFLKFEKFRNSRYSQNSVWDPNFFPRRALPNCFCFTLSLHWWYSIPRLVWFEQKIYCWYSEPSLIWFG